jgi:hypothetical protein
MRPNRRTSTVELAAWYREFAERAGSSVIWDSRLIGRRYRKEADLLEQDCAHNSKRAAS